MKYSMEFCICFAEQCNYALGLESGAVADFQISASSAHDMGNVGPQHAR